MISLGYYLRVVATMWMRSQPATAPAPGVLAPIAGGSPEADVAGDVAGGGAGSVGGAGGASGGAGGVGGSGGAGGAGEWPGIAESVPDPEVALVAAVFAAATVVFGIIPTPLFNLAAHAAHAFGGLF